MRRLLFASLPDGAVVGFGAVARRCASSPVDEQGACRARASALRHLDNTGIFMMATAHPDDENNALLVMLNRGLGYRTALATATRGNGGQNEIGPELFEALGVLRTEELAAMHRFDGAEQYFTRAVDFGYSFSIEETFEKWGREEILGGFRPADSNRPPRRHHRPRRRRRRRRAASSGVGDPRARSVQGGRRSDEVSRTD